MQFEDKCGKQLKCFPHFAVQITIPISVRNRLNLKAGDKIVILEENGRFYFENSAMLAFKRAEEAFTGEAEKVGFTTEEEMQDYMKEIRKEVRGY